MTTVAAWLESRRPPPPEALARRVHDALGPDAGRDVSEATEALLAAAQRLAATVLGDGDGGRGTASDLLAVDATDVKSLQAMGDALRERLGSGVGVLAASFGDGKHTMLVIVTDDLRDRGVRADLLVKEIAAIAGGRGGGKAHMAQAGLPDAERIGEALAQAPALVRAHLDRLS